MNKVFMVGRLAQEPQQFVTQNGITQSRISIASSDNWNKNETYFFPCVAWQSTANFINSYLHKGDLVAVDGKLIRRSYISKEGKTVYVIEVVIESIKPLSSKNNNVDVSSIDKSYNVGNKQSNTNKFSSKQPENLGNEFDEEFGMGLKNQSKKSNSLVNEAKEETFEDDPFALNSDDDQDEIVSLDWLDEFKE